MITSQKLEKIAQIGGIACETYSDDSFPKVILSEIETLLDAEAAIFYDMSGPFARPVFGESYYHCLEPKYGDIYGEYYNTMDPCFETLKPDTSSQFLSSASTHRSIDNQTAYENTEYYQDFLAPQNIHSSIIFTLKSEENLLGLFGFQRPKSRPAFNEDSHLLVRLISAPLLQALEKRRLSSPNDASHLSVKISGFDLTPRQIQISKLVTLGLTNPEISKQLGIKGKTVENHLTQIYAQTGAKNRVTLAQALSLILQSTQ